MNKIILITAIVVCLSIKLFAQNDTTSKWHYAELVGATKLMSTKVNISIDYGEATKLFQDTRLRDENGKLQSFNSMVDAMNYMGNSGWEFVQAYVIGGGSTGYVYHWLLKHKY